MSNQEDLERLLNEIRKCSACQLRKTCNQVVPGAGPADTRVAVFGEGPGETEDKDGIPFVGYSGQFLRQSMKRVSLDDSAMFISSAVRCRPPDGREPNEDEKKACWPWTLKLLQIVRPKVIVTLGRHALEIFSDNYGFKIGQQGIKKIAGTPIYVPSRNFYIYPMFHPTFATRQSATRELFAAHLGYLKQALPGWIARPPMSQAELNSLKKKKPAKKAAKKTTKKKAAKPNERPRGGSLLDGDTL